MTNTDNERRAFEAKVRTWPNYSDRTLARDGRYPDYYGNPVVQGAWEGWLARAGADGWRPIETRPTSEDGSFLVLIPGNDMCESLAVQVSNFEGYMYPDYRDAIIDWKDRIVDALAWAPLPAPPKEDGE